jgi:hypothetical protein
LFYKLILNFQLVSAEIIELLERDGKLPVDLWKTESFAFLSAPLKCHKCDFLARNISHLKSHLRSYHSNRVVASRWEPPVYSDYFNSTGNAFVNNRRRY